MTNISEYSIQAELALAAYANLSTGQPNQANLVLQAGMSSGEAAHFASNWSVVAQYNDSTDLSVTVFESTTDHKRYLAIRGTDSNIDLLTDAIDIAIIGAPDWQPQYQHLNTVQLDNFTSGDFGIVLKGELPTITPDRTITGDLAPVNFGGGYHTDSLGNIVVDPNTSEANRADILNGSSDFDLIRGLGGNDTMFGKGGDDRLEGGDGTYVVNPSYRLTTGNTEWRIAA